jgi:2-oxoglutarate dehydrogenase E2 component (dihydrolipoamide succinyltransferase)
MNVKIKLPSLGENVLEATMVAWLKQPGDAVVHGEIIAEVMTDKTNVEIPAPASGTLVEHQAQVDDVLHPGAVLGTIRM